MSEHKDGVVYVVTSQSSRTHIEAALSSAKSVARYSPGIGIHIFVDDTGREVLDERGDLPFTSVSSIREPHYRSKVDYLLETPFERTLYLDADTLVVEDIREMFEVLVRFDIGLAHAHVRNEGAKLELWNVHIPPSFPQFNGGVILYRSTPQVLRLLEAWKLSFHEAGFKKDQVTLREILWMSDLRIATLPPEYNVRYRKYLRLWSEQEAKPRILHYAKFLGRDSRYVHRLSRRYKRVLTRCFRAKAGPNRKRNDASNRPCEGDDAA